MKNGIGTTGTFAGSNGVTVATAMNNETKAAQSNQPQAASVNAPVSTETMLVITTEEISGTPGECVPNPVATASPQVKPTAMETNGGGTKNHPLSMFTSMQDQQDAQNVNLSSIDLDDLFHDCYFGDFPVPPFKNQSFEDGIPMSSGNEGSTAGSITTGLMPASTTDSSMSTTSALPIAVATATPMNAMVQQQQQQQQNMHQQPQAQMTSNLPQKRTNEEAMSTSVVPTPISVLSSSVSSYMPQQQQQQGNASMIPQDGTATSMTSSYGAPMASTTNPTATGYVVPTTMGTRDTSMPTPMSMATSTHLGGGGGGTTRQLTDQQKVERRNRNREHAKRSRLRKKFLLESLQEQIHGLQSEIEELKGIIKSELPDRAEALLERVSGNKGQFTPLPMPSGFGPVKTLMEPDFRLMSALSGSQQNFAISDPSLPDNPIVYVSQGFLDLTGYTLDQVLGRNCRFLQGPGTDQSAVDVIRKGVREGVDTSVCLLNYKADGTPFWNQFFVAALRDAENNVVNFVGVQCEVSKATVESQFSKDKDGETTTNATVNDPTASTSTSNGTAATAAAAPVATAAAAPAAVPVAMAPPN